MSLDEKYIPPTVVTLTSVLDNSNLDTYHTVTILTPREFELGNRAKMGILKKYENCEINFVDMGDRYKEVFAEFWPPSSLHRMDVAGALPLEKKCIFLDGDVIVRHDLSVMYNVDISNYYVAGVRCVLFTIHHEKGHFQFLSDLGIPGVDQYICCGVLLMNLEKIRKDNVEDQFHRLIEKVKLKNYFADQDVINTVCYGRILLLPIKFDLLINYVNINNTYNTSKYAKLTSTQTEWEESRDPTIVHFAGKNFKPWKHPRKTAFHMEWWDYAKRTNFYNEKDKNYLINKEEKRKKKKYRNKRVK